MNTYVCFDIAFSCLIAQLFLFSAQVKIVLFCLYQLLQTSLVIVNCPLKSDPISKLVKNILASNMQIFMQFSFLYLTPWRSAAFGDFRKKNA